MSTPTKIVVSQCEYWIRVNLAVEVYLKEALLNILHNYDADPSYVGLPDDEGLFYSRMCIFKLREEHKLRTIIRADQWSILCPPSGRTDSKTLDITLLILVIRYETTVAPPIGGWGLKEPCIMDNSKAAFCLRARQLRNETKHGVLSDILSEQQFECYWMKVKFVLNGLAYNSIHLFDNMKTESLDPYVKQRITIIEDKCIDLEKKIPDLSTVDSNTNDVSLLIAEINVLKISNTKKVTALEARVIELESKTLLTSDQLRNDIDSPLSIRNKQIGEFEERVENIEGKYEKDKKGYEAERNPCFNDQALPEVLEIISNMIGKDYKQLANILLLNFGWCFWLSDSDKMANCFMNAKLPLSWKDINNALSRLKRDDIIKEIKKKTCLTEGLLRVSRDLKNHYKRTKKQRVSTPIRDQHGVNYKEIIYVDLKIGLPCDLREEDKSSDREYFRRQKISDDIIDYKDVVKEEDKMIIVRGIAGIGKTSFLESFVDNWSNDKNLEEIKYVIKFTSRELNNLKKVKSWCQLFREKFPLVFKDIEVEDIVSQKFLIVVDGFDELRNNEEIYNISRDRNPNASLLLAVYDLINPRSDIFPNKQVIICGRPQSCDILLKAFSEVCEIKLLEITGFSTKSVQLFVNNYFTEETKATEVHQKINDSSNLSSFSKIPIFLFIICSIFESQFLIDDLDTSTKLYIAACLVYLREHTRDHIHMKERSLNALCECDEMMKVITDLAKFSYISLKSKKITFSEKEFQDVDFANIIIKSGIIEQIEGGEEGKEYQFKHLVLQEFLAALYIFIDNNLFNDVFNAKQMKNCVPIIAGLQGILLPNSQAPNYIKTFVKKIFEHSRAPIPEAIVNTFASTINECNFLTFLPIFYEYHAGTVSSNVKELIIAVLKKADISLFFHHHLHELIFLLTNINVTSINGIYIDMHDGVLSLKELELLSPYVVLCKTFCIYNTTFNSDGLAQLSSSITKTVNDSIKAAKSSVTQEDRISLKDRDTNPVQIEKKGCYLRELDFIYCNLNDEHINKLKPCITYIEKLRIGGNNDFTPVAMETISITIVEAVQKKECCLKQLEFSVCKLNDKHINKLEPCIRYIEKFNLGGNEDLTPVAMETISITIVEAVQKKECCLKQLDFSVCKLNYKHINKLEPCIRYIEKLDLGGNKYLTPVAMETISITIVEALQKKECCLKELIIIACKLNDKHINKLEPCIRYIEKFNLGYNKDLTPDAMETISITIVEAVRKKECCLKQLHFSFCNLNDEHINKLEPCIRYIEKLDLGGNNDLTPVAMETISITIVEAVQKKECCLKELNLCYCKLTAEHVINLKPCKENVKIEM